MLDILSKHSSLGFLAIELKNKKVHYNAKYQEILDVNLNYEFSLQLFKKLLDLLNNKSLFLALLKKSKKDKESIVRDFKLKRSKNNIPQWLHIDGYFLYDEIEKPHTLVISITDISQKKYDEQIQKLIESAVTNVNHAIVITEAEPIDLPGPRILFVNESFTETTGYSLEDVIGESPRILQGPKSDPNTLLEIKHALKNWQPIKCEVLNYKKNGEEFWVELDIKPVKNKKGWYTHWISVQRDITKLKLTENQLIESESKMRHLINDSPDLIQSIGLKGEIAFTNNTWKELLGYKEEEIKHLNIFSIIDESCHENCMNEFRLIMSGKALKNIQTIYKTKSGKKIYLEGNAVPRFMNNKVVGTQGFFKNITDQKLAENALNNNILKTERILNSLNECVWGVSLPEYSIEFMSQSVINLYEYSMEAWKKNIKIWIDCVHPDDKNSVLHMSDQLFEKGETYQEYRIITASKKIKWIYSTTKVIKNSEGTPVLMTGISGDITQRKLAEEQVKESQLNYKKLLDNSLELIVSLNTKGEILFSNKTFLNVLDFPNDDAQIKNLFDFIYTKCREKFLFEFEMALNNKVVENITFSIKTLSNKEIYLNGNLIPILKNNQVVSVQGIFLDITKKIELEKEKEKFESELKIVQENEKIGYFLYDFRKDISATNNEVINEIYGVDASYHKNLENFIKFIHPEDRDMVEGKFQKSVEQCSQIEEDLEFRIIRHNDQSVRWVKYLISFEFDPAGKPLSFSGTVKDITTQKKSESELQKLNNQIDYLFKTVDEIFFTIDAVNDKIMYISQCTLNMFGYSNKEYYHDFSILFRIVHPDDLVLFMNDRETLLKGQPVSREYRIIHKQSGLIKWIESTSTPYLNKDDQLLQINVITKDITVRKQNELNLKSTLTELKHYQDAVNRSAIVSITDTKGIITFVNEKFCEISKYNSDELLGQPHSIVNSNYHSKSFFYDLWETISGGNIWKGEIRNKSKNGELYWVDSTIIPFIENGKPYQYLSIRYDMTEKVKIKEEIGKQKEFYETILNDMPADIAVFDKNFRYIYINPTAVKDDEVRKFMIGKTDFDYAELKKKNLSIAKNRLELLHEASKTRTGISFEETIELNNNEKKYILRKTYPYFDKNNDMQYIIGFGLDITKEKKHELSLAQSLVEKETLLGEIHHRVKNNLALIDGVVELKKALEKDQYLIDTLSDIQSRIKTVALVHQKLYQNDLFSKIDIKDYINELAVYHQKMFNKVNSDNVTFELSENQIFLDISKSVSFGLLLNELISNSLKYAVINHHVTISILLSQQENAILFIYKDSGKGLTADMNENPKQGFGFKLIQTLIKQLKATHKIATVGHFEIEIHIPFPNVVTN